MAAASPHAPFVIGIAGGSGSGKTTIARALVDTLSSHEVALIEQDCYYRDLAHLPPAERAAVNFDHPDAIEVELIAAHLDALAANKAVMKPRYDFGRHVRAVETDRLAPRPILVVEGILVLAIKALRDRMHMKVFVDTDADIRVIRRIRRDLESRGRTFAQIRKQYYETVRPMHLAFVEPSKRHADVIIPEGGQNRVALDVLVSHVRERLRMSPSGYPQPVQRQLNLQRE